MPIAVAELFNARRGDAYTSRERDYLVTGTDEHADLDEHDAIIEAANFSPAFLAGSEGHLLRTNATISRVISNSQMVITVQYGEAGGPSLAIAPGGSVEYEFNYQAPSVQIYQSLQTIGVWDKTGLAPGKTFHGAIGVDVDADNRKQIQGVSTAPGNTTSTWTFTGFAISTAYEVLVEGLMGCVNSEPFKGRPIGSMRFVQCASQVATGQSKTQIRFGFQFEPNQTNIVIGSAPHQITVPAKNGHDYLWIQRQLADVGGELLPAPAYAVVDRVFRYADLNQLGF
jgi:hypothetical protein